MRWLLLILLTVPAWSAPKHWHEDDKHWKKHGNHEYDDHFDHHAGGCYFQPGEVRVIREYYVPQRHGLPPGLQKKLNRGGRLPPGWERKIQPLPVVVERQMGVVPEGYRRGFIEGQAVVYAPRTGIVIDVFAVF